MARAVGGVLRQQYGAAVGDLQGSQEHPPKRSTHKGTHPEGALPQKEHLPEGALPEGAFPPKEHPPEGTTPGAWNQVFKSCPWGVNFIRLSRLPHLLGFSSLFL